MTDQPLHVSVIIGSTREGRFGDAVARWIAALAQSRTDVRVEVIDLVEAALPARLPAGRHAAVEAFAQRIERADAFVVVTPEYNHSFPAPLKQAIDLAFAEWQAKPVGFVSYGGISGGLRAVEQLRLVFAELHAVTVRDTVSFQGARAAFDERGEPKTPEASRAAADKMIGRLVWWGRALRAARAAHPYPA